MTEDDFRKAYIAQENLNGLKRESLLLKKIDGKIVFENLLINGKSNDDVAIFNRKKSLELILKYKKYDLLKNVTIRNFLRKKDKNGTYLDYVLKLFSHGENINISFYDPFSKNESLNNIAEFYIIYAKHGLEKYLPPMSLESLKSKETDSVGKMLTSKKSLLQMMIEKSSKDFVVKKFLSSSDIQDIEIITILKEVDNRDKKIRLDVKDEVSSKYLSEYYKNHVSCYKALNDADKRLLQNLIDACADRCDEKSLRTLVYSYIEQLFAGNRKNAYLEINKLINIFKSDETFSIKTKDSSYFSLHTNEIVLEDNITNVFNHELGHALFHKLTDCNPPIEFFNILNRIRNDRNNVSKVANLSNTFKKYIKPLSEASCELYEKHKPNISSESIKEILDMSQEEALKKCSHRLRKQNSLKSLFERSFTEEEYKSQYEETQKNILKNVIKRVKLYPIIAISDIVDAIYGGHYLAGNLKDLDNKKIKPIFGHGIYYYSNSMNVFDEIFANYCSLKKNVEDDCIIYEDSRHGQITDPITALRIIVGNELVNFLDRYYENQILNSDKYNNVRSR